MRVSAVLAMAVVAAAAACSPVEDGPTAPPPHFVAVGPGEGNSPDRIRIRDQGREDFTLVVTGCIEEPLVVTGTANLIIQAQDNPADRVHYRSHANLQGVSGVGQLTGTRYRLAQEFNATYNYVAFLDPPKLETTQIYRYRLIGDGPANNSYFDISFHLTITPDGKIASEFTRVEGRCRQDGGT